MRDRLVGEEESRMDLYKLVTLYHSLMTQALKH